MKLLANVTSEAVLGIDTNRNDVTILTTVDILLRSRKAKHHIRGVDQISAQTLLNHLLVVARTLRKDVVGQLFGGRLPTG